MEYEWFFFRYGSNYKGVKMQSLNFIVLMKVMSKKQVQLLFIFNKKKLLSFINFTTIIQIIIRTL
jgi:hypothetical protein